MNSGATSERVYDTIKERVLSGVVLPGESSNPRGWLRNSTAA
ncbi:hypothetical protein [Hankyongella ginsenosidimutans]|nr:hypothetical protein [Hankyongella ginsenosidimutans]